MSMELTLRINTEGLDRVSVFVDDQLSHEFQLNLLRTDEVSRNQNFQTNSIEYGKYLFNILFPSNSLAHQAIGNERNRILLIVEVAQLQSVAWEYLHNGSEYLIENVNFIRGIPKTSRVARNDNIGDIHIIGVPSNPLS